MKFNNITMIKSKYGRYIFYPILVLILISLFQKKILNFLPKYGFDLEGSLISPNKIYKGGPGKDGIPSIDKPKFIEAGKADFLLKKDRVLGVFYNGVAKAYPIKILNWHEIVNDNFFDEPLVVSYCPLCGSGITFSALTAGSQKTFGVSGLLYNNDVLLYDRESESLWSQILGKAISGPLKGTSLKRIATTHTTWEDWRNRHKDTLVLSTDTGYYRDYSKTPYIGYEESDVIFFPIEFMDRQYHPKELVIGLEINGEYKAYPFTELSKNNKTIEETFAGQLVRVEFDSENKTGRITGYDGEDIPIVILYWFAWSGFHPKTELYRAGGRGVLQGQVH